MWCKFLSASRANMGNIIALIQGVRLRGKRPSSREEEKLMLVSPPPWAQHGLEQRSSRLWGISLDAPGWKEHEHCLSCFFGKGRPTLQRDYYCGIKQLAEGTLGETTTIHYCLSRCPSVRSVSATIAKKIPGKRTLPGCPLPVDDVRHNTALPYSSASPSITRVKPCHLLVSLLSISETDGGREVSLLKVHKNSVKVLPFAVPFSNSHIWLVLFIHHFASTTNPPQNSFEGFGQTGNFITIIHVVKCCHQLEKTPDSRESFHRWTSPGTPQNSSFSSPSPSPC